MLPLPSYVLLYNASNKQLPIDLHNHVSEIPSTISAVKTQKSSSIIYGILLRVTHDYSYTHADTLFIDLGAIRRIFKLSLFNKFRKFIYGLKCPTLLKTKAILKSISLDKLKAH